jgi:hypothetical protein
VKRRPAWGPVELSVDKSIAQAPVTRGPERGKFKNLHCVQCVTREWLVNYS